jgi:pyruvate/2-oxoglutarate dehydrogenase complex dihydrolipoamide dehydrogenase (E3) component
MPDYDIAVIGAGAAGLSVANVAAQLGLRTALIERDRMGGDCLNAGCVPSKALLAAAHAAQAGRDASRFGVRFAEPVIDWPAVQAHIRGVIEAIAPADSPERYRALGADVLLGEARFAARDALDVTVGGATRRITAGRIVIAAGSRATVPDIPGLDRVPYLTNATLFGQAGGGQAGGRHAGADKPEHLLILGGGGIGLEMAQAYAELGCQVTVVEAHTLGGREDPELVDVLRDALRRVGVSIIEGVAVVAAEMAAESKLVLVLADGRRITGSTLLVAAGRTPNLEGLALERGGVAASARGIATDRALRSTTNRRVFAVGDIADPAGIGPRYLTHVGSYHAGLVVRAALFRLPVRLNYAALPRVTYTDPELAQTGLTEAEARSAGHNVTVLRWSLSENDRAQCERETGQAGDERQGGLVKLVIKGGRVLGAGIVAPHAGEMIGVWTLAIAQGAKLSQLGGMIVPYPTRSEAGKRALGTALLPRLFAPRVRSVVRQLARLP